MGNIKALFLFLTLLTCAAAQLSNEPQELTITRILNRMGHFYEGSENRTCSLDFNFKNWFSSAHKAVKHLNIIEQSSAKILNFLSEGLHPELTPGEPFTFKNKLYEVLDSDGPGYAYNDCKELGATLISPAEDEDLKYYANLIKSYNEVKNENFTHIYLLINIVKHKDEDGTLEYALQYIYGKNKEINKGVIETSNDNFGRYNIESGSITYDIEGATCKKAHVRPRLQPSLSR